MNTAPACQPRQEMTTCYCLTPGLAVSLTDISLCNRHTNTEQTTIYDPTHTHPFNGPFSWTTQVSQYQKGKTNLDFIEARDSEWQWHQLGHMQVCTSLQTDKHASTPPLSFLQAGCPSCRQTNSVKALKAATIYNQCINVSESINQST